MMDGMVELLAETESGKLLEILVHEIPRSKVISHSGNGYWYRHSTACAVVEAGGRYELDADGYPLTGFYVHVVGTGWFRTLGEVRDFYNHNMRDQIVVEIS